MSGINDSRSFIGSQGLTEVLCGAAHIVPWDGDGDDSLRADERHALECIGRGRIDPRVAVQRSAPIFDVLSIHLPDSTGVT